jgi:dienelactone hydrolase
MMVAAVSLGVVAVSAEAAVKTETVEYTHGETVLEGYLAYDDAREGKQPGVAVVHEWKGLGPYAQRRAEQLAELGYVAFAIDMYGKGVRAKDHEEAAQLAGIYRGDRALMRARAGAGLDVLRQHPRVDADRLAAIGYCFGGTTVLEMARGGADLDGVVSFHGGLDTPSPAQPGMLRAKVLALSGADDPHVPPEQVAGFEQEMRAAKADWQLVAYGNAVHSFTVPEAGSDPSKGAAYNPTADRRSWQAMRAFLDEVFQ